MLEAVESLESVLDSVTLDISQAALNAVTHLIEQATDAQSRAADALTELAALNTGQDR